MEEAYVSFETAQLLKEKGFNEKCFALYNPEGMLIQSGIRLNNIQVGRVKGSYSAPTLQMAMKWLREVHKLVICAEIGNENFKGNTDYSNPDRWYWFFDLTNEKGVVIKSESDYILNEYSSYEDAVEAAIKYCLTQLVV